MRCGTWRSVTPRSSENTVIMETGGMKGYREEIPKEEFHRILCDAFGVGEIHSEYGMAELTSQAYSQGRQRVPLPGLDARHGTRRRTTRSTRSRQAHAAG